MSTLFLSDLHLDKNRPEIINYFVDALSNLGNDISSIYILGDLVEYWVGDDDPGIGLQKVFDAIHKKTSTTPIYFMHGNRDFLMSESFCKKYGMELIKKIDHKLFWPLSLSTTLLFCLFARGRTEVFSVLFVYIATIISLFMLMAILHGLISDPEVKATGKIKKSRLFTYMFLHVIFLFGSIGIGVHFMGNRIIIAVLNYVVQIFVLGVGLRKNLK